MQGLKTWKAEKTWSKFHLRPRRFGTQVSIAGQWRRVTSMAVVGPKQRKASILFGLLDLPTWTVTVACIWKNDTLPNPDLYWDIPG